MNSSVRSVIRLKGALEMSLCPGSVPSMPSYSTQGRQGREELITECAQCLEDCMRRELVRRWVRDRPLEGRPDRTLDEGGGRPASGAAGGHGEKPGQLTRL